MTMSDRVKPASEPGLDDVQRFLLAADPRKHEQGPCMSMLRLYHMNDILCTNVFVAGVTYVVEDCVGSGSFSRVFRVRAQRRWGQEIYAAKVMRKEPKRLSRWPLVLAARYNNDDSI